MLKSNYRFIVSSQTFHPYQEWISQVQEKIFLSVSVGLLKRLANNHEKIISEKLDTILHDNKVWNQVKEIKGFNTNRREVSDPLIDSTRKLLLFNKLISCLSTISEPFTELGFVREILDKIPDDMTSVVLEEMLDSFMKDELYRLSPDSKNPFLKEIKRARTIDEYFAEISEIADDNEHHPDRVDEEIQSIQLEKQNTVFTSNNQHCDKEGKKTIESEIREYVQSVLQSLHSKSNLINFTQEYIDQLETHSGIKIYINRPTYKLALRVRNILIFSYSNEEQSFSQEGISSILKSFKESLIKNIEIYLFLTCVQNLDFQNELIQKVIYKIVCKIQNKIIEDSVYKPEILYDKFEFGSREHIDFLTNSLVDDYHVISLEKLHVSIDDLCNQFVQILNFKINSIINLRNDLNHIFIAVAKQIALAEKIEFKISANKFENQFFANNSSNILVEFSRHFLSNTSFTFEEFINLTNSVLIKQDFINEICLPLYENLKMDYSWSVFFPVTGINVSRDSHQAWFHDLADSLSEIHEIKFLSPEILKSISVEATSKIDGGPILFEFKNATACASFKGIKAGDARQALKIAITKLIDAMEIQWYLTDYGHQYKIEPLAQNSLITAFCKKEFNDTSSTSSWWSSTLCFKRLGTCNYDLTEKTRKYLAIPARRIKILTQRAESSDPLGELARNILHCIKLFRQGYFSERLSERFRLYWTVIESLFSMSSTEDSYSKIIKHLIPYRLSLFRLGITNLLKSEDKYEYKQARMWMREDIEDLYTFVRNPLIHDGVEHTPAYERLMDRFESIVSSILQNLAIIVIYKTLPDNFLEQGMKGIIEFMEIQQPSLATISIPEQSFASGTEC